MSPPQSDPPSSSAGSTSVPPPPRPHAAKPISAQMARGAAWMVLFKLIDRGLGIASTVILARLLTPGDFGLLAMATSISAVLDLLGAFSFDLAIIQNPKAERRHYDTAWTFNVLFGLGCGVALLCVSSPAASFYEEPRLAAVVAWLGLSAVLNGLENIGVLAFRKELEFRKEFRMLAAKRVAGAVVTVTLALALRSYWALVAGILTTRALGVVISYRVHPYRPRFSLEARRDLFHFSKWLLLNNLVSFLSVRSSDFILGKMAGKHALGVYGISYEISNLPTTELAAPINRAVYPGYARMKENTAVLRQGFLNVISMIALFGLPAGFGIACIAEPLVHVFLGPKWLDAIPLIRLLAIYGSLSLLLTNSGYVYIAVGRPHLVSLIALVHVGIQVPLLLYLVRQVGTIGAAWAVLGTVVVLIPLNFVVLARLIGISAASLTAAFWRPFLATGAMIGAVHAVQSVLPAASRTSTHAMHLAWAVLIGAVSYAVVVFGSWRLAHRPSGAEEYVLRKISRRD